MKIEAINFNPQFSYYKSSNNKITNPLDQPISNINIDNVTITNGSGPVYCENLTGTSFDLTTKASTNDLVKTMYKKIFALLLSVITILSHLIAFRTPLSFIVPKGINL